MKSTWRCYIKLNLCTRLLNIMYYQKAFLSVHKHNTYCHTSLSWLLRNLYYWVSTSNWTKQTKLHISGSYIFNYHLKTLKEILRWIHCLVCLIHVSSPFLPTTLQTWIFYKCSLHHLYIHPAIQYLLSTLNTSGSVLILTMGIQHHAWQ